MPIYVFKCEDEHEQELFIKVSELGLEHKCSVCGKPLKLVFTGEHKIRFMDKCSVSTRPTKLV
jgi:uncharacterized CHY-type Zn-finger protein